jgi:hypothetical protein
LRTKITNKNIFIDVFTISIHLKINITLIQFYGPK